MRGGTQGRGSGRGRGDFDLGALAKQAGSLSGRSGGSRGLGTAASGLAGAASGLAGGGLTQRFLGSGSEGSDEDFKREVLDQLALMEERLARLEGEVLGPVEEEGAQVDIGTFEEGAGGTETASTQ